MDNLHLKRGNAIHRGVAGFGTKHWFGTNAIERRQREREEVISAVCFPCILIKFFPLFISLYCEMKLHGYIREKYEGYSS